jgi:predicted Fe-Mo cluster-binding NifX family protein
MRIAIATEQDFVSSEFGGCPFCTIVDIEDEKIRETLIVPNPGYQQAFWTELLCRNSIRHLIVGNMESRAQSELRWRGIDVIAGVEGRIDEVVRRFSRGEFHPSAESHRGGGEAFPSPASSSRR